MLNWFKKKLLGEEEVVEKVEEVSETGEVEKNVEPFDETQEVEETEVPEEIEPVEEVVEEVKVEEEIAIEDEIQVEDEIVTEEEIEVEEVVEEEIAIEEVEPIEEEIEPIEEEIEPIEENTIEEVEEPAPLNFFERLKQGLTKTRDEMSVKINTILGAYVKIDDEMLEDLEDILITADIGVETTMSIIDNLRERIIRDKVNDPKEVRPLLKDEIQKLMEFEGVNNSLISTTDPLVILVIGVNGVGKTTTIGKISARLKKEGKNVLVAAADTFRAAAIDQLKTWGDRAGVGVIAHKEGSDPAAVVYDAVQAAKSRKVDVLICDTAGRLHNKANLMKELEKIYRVIEKEYPEATRETLLVVDATTGQNAIIQAKTFKEVADITGVAITKLDGTAKGGVAIPIQSQLKLPIKLVGVGEKIEDLQDFNTQDFVNALFD